jgi:hypothetical protein
MMMPYTKGSVNWVLCPFARITVMRGDKDSHVISDGKLGLGVRLTAVEASANASMAYRKGLRPKRDTRIRTPAMDPDYSSFQSVKHDARECITTKKWL